IVAYAINPPLPAGLGFSTTTGVISGTPTVLAPAADHTVTGSNSAGSTTTKVSIRVVDVAPASLAYATSPAVYTKGQPIASNAPSSTGGLVVSYAILPALPAGLGLDPATGVITGTPTVLSDATDYVVTATNTGGMAT